MEEVRALIRQRQAALGLNDAALSRTLGRDRTYMSRFLNPKTTPDKGLSAADARKLEEVLGLPAYALAADRHAPAEPPPQGTGAVEREWLRGQLSPATTFRVLISGPASASDLAKLIRLLEAQRSVIEDQKPAA